MWIPFVGITDRWGIGPSIWCTRKKWAACLLDSIDVELLLSLRNTVQTEYQTMYGLRRWFCSWYWRFCLCNWRSRGGHGESGQSENLHPTYDRWKRVMTSSKQSANANRPQQSKSNRSESVKGSSTATTMVTRLPLEARREVRGTSLHTEGTSA